VSEAERWNTWWAWSVGYVLDLRVGEVLAYLSCIGADDSDDARLSMLQPQRESA